MGCIMYCRMLWGMRPDNVTHHENDNTLECLEEDDFHEKLERLQDAAALLGVPKSEMRMVLDHWVHRLDIHEDQLKLTLYNNSILLSKHFQSHLKNVKNYTHLTDRDNDCMMMILGEEDEFGNTYIGRPF